LKIEDENEFPEKNISPSNPQDMSNDKIINKKNMSNYLNPNTNNKEDHRLNDQKNNINSNNLKNLSTRAYLEMTVVPTVMAGMTELAKEKPDNPLEWLGNYILKQSKK